eukprot:1112034-Pleurochrysis_carterae.AAC.2
MPTEATMSEEGLHQKSMGGMASEVQCKRERATIGRSPNKNGSLSSSSQSGAAIHSAVCSSWQGKVPLARAQRLMRSQPRLPFSSANSPNAPLDGVAPAAARAARGCCRRRWPRRPSPA